MRSLRVLSRLLTYPNAELWEQLEPLKEVLLNEGIIKPKALKGLNRFIDELAATDLLQAQENYVELFDRGRAHCLHLYEHVHGESRFRGQAMIDLAGRYAEKGLQLGVGELPDYLPVFLEFVSICEPTEGLETLSNAAPVIATLGEKLKRKKSGYAIVMRTIVDLSGAKLNEAEIRKAADAALPNIQTLDELDREWEEPEAFGDFAAAANCGTCGTNDLPRPINTGGR